MVKWDLKMPEAIAAEHVRLFVALMIPEEVKTEMERVQVDLRFPRVIWIGVRDEQGGLERLQLTVQNSARDFTTQEPEERFTGHVTLGRVKGIKREETKTVTKLAATLASRSFGQWTADKLQIMRSELSSEAAHHTVLATLLLGETTA